MEHVIRFINSSGAHANDADLCMREFSESLMYVNLISGLMYYWEHLISLFNTNLSKLTLN